MSSGLTEASNRSRIRRILSACLASILLRSLFVIRHSSCGILVSPTEGPHQREESLYIRPIFRAMLGVDKDLVNQRGMAVAQRRRSVKMRGSKTINLAHSSNRMPWANGSSPE